MIAEKSSLITGHSIVFKNLCYQTTQKPYMVWTGDPLFAHMWNKHAYYFVYCYVDDNAILSIK